MKWRQLRWYLVGVVGCVLAAPAEGHVSEGSDNERASEVAKEALRALQQGRMEEAAERYRTAWGIYKSPWFMCELGHVEAKLQRPRDAALSLSRCLRLLKPEDKELFREKIERELQEMRAQVGQLIVQANVPEAEVAVDGKVTGKLPLIDPIFVDPGSHGVEVRAPGYQSDVRLAVLTAGTSMLIRMRLQPMRIEVAPPPKEDSPIEPTKEAKSPAPAPSLGLATKAPAPALSPSGVFEPARAPVRPVVVFTGLGLGVAGAVVGVAGLMAGDAAAERGNTMYRDLSASPYVCEHGTSGPCANIESAIDEARILTAVGVVGIAVSTVGCGLIVYEFVRSTPQAGTANVRMDLVAGPSGGALKLIGSF